MATNQYFNNYNATNEQNLIEDLVVESIQIKGLDVAYIPRTQANIDFLYNEDPTNVFNTFANIEMYPLFVDGFDGDQMMTVFGDEFKKSGTFVVSKKRFAEEFPVQIDPKEGDLIYMPITNAVLEIMYIEKESPFFEKGKQYVFELKTEMFEYSYETVETGDADIDAILDNMNIDDPENMIEDFGQNDDLDGSSNDINYDPSNPFGVN